MNLQTFVNTYLLNSNRKMVGNIIRIYCFSIIIHLFNIHFKAHLIHYFLFSSIHYPSLCAKPI